MFTPNEASRPALGRPHDSIAGACDHHPTRDRHVLCEVVRVDPVGMLRWNTRAPEDGDLLQVRIATEDPNGMKQLLERDVHELQLGAGGPIVQVMHARREQLSDQLDLGGIVRLPGSHHKESSMRSLRSFRRS